MKSKRGITFSVPVIVAFIIGLILLVVLSYYIMEWSGLFGRGVIDCEGKGGICIKEECSDAGYEQELFKGKGCSMGDNFSKEHHCCLVISQK